MHEPLPPSPEDIELELFIEALQRAYGYDFSGYLRASLKRRVQALVAERGLAGISALTGFCLHNPQAVPEVLARLSVAVSELFRDPQVFRRLRETVLPDLATHPQITVWHAGCAGGEEVYSLAIVLQECGLQARSCIYATDINTAALTRAREGIYPLREARQYAENYLAAGGSRSFSDYIHAQYEHIALDARLRRNMTFAAHNLASDSVFIEAQLILCRNVFIYFDHALRRRALQLFADSLVRGGYLLLGLREAVDPDFMRQHFESLGDGFYRRRAAPSDSE